jgi:predicted DNA-binding transcriptional regulator YafY
MAKSDRLLLILNLLTTRRRMAVAELARECGVTERTIYRDIGDISRANFPIYYDRGYRLLRSDNLPPLNLTEEEHAILKTVLSGWPLAGTSPYRKIARGLAAKLERFHRQTGIRPAQHSVQRPRQKRKSTSADRIIANLTTLVQAADQRKTVEFRYIPLIGKPARQKVDPYFVTFRRQALYLVGHCRSSKSFQPFQLARISRVKVTDDRFPKDSSITPDSLFAHSWDTSLGSPITMRVRFKGRAGRMIESGGFHSTEKITRRGADSIIYRARINSIEEFGSWILGFGEDAEVLEPIELKNWVRARAQRVLTAAKAIAGTRTRKK